LFYPVNQQVVNKNQPCTLEKLSAASELQLQAINGKRVTLVFDEPELTSDAGLLVVGAFEKRTLAGYAA
jgi:hypothetical protein